MAKNRNEEYDWLNDPFDEKKSAEEQEKARMSTGSKVGIGCGCAVVIVGLIAIGIAVVFMGVFSGDTLGF